MIPQDLRTTRKAKGLTAKDLASGLLRPATVSQIETGKIVPRKSTRLRLESVIGKIDWRKTLSAGDRSHILHALSEFLNETEPGSRQRIRFAKQVLRLIEETTEEIEETS